jgi:hypothetical protein
MGRRVLPALFAVLAAIADSQGAHGLARDALFAALPFAAVGALVAFGSYLDSGDPLAGAQALCSAAIVAFLVVSCAARNAALHGVPPLGVSSLVAVLALFALKAALALAPHARRLSGFTPAKP